MPYLCLFLRLIVRPMLREKTRSLLVLFAVSLGVAVALAIELAGDAAASSFHTSLQTVAGEYNLEVRAAGGVPQSLVGDLARLPWAIRVTPRIEDHATVAATGETIPLIGIDFIAHANDPDGARFSLPQNTSIFNDINSPDALWVTRSLCDHVGGTVTLLINDRQHAYTVRGFLPSSAQVSGDVAVMDIDAAQQATGKRGSVDRILLKVPDRPGFAQWQQRIRTLLPPGVQLLPQGSETAANRRMLAAFRWNLRILSYIALLVGAFLIYNTISVSVVRRRAEIGTVRALGAGRRAVLLAFLAEAAVFGVLGSLLALPLGRFLAGGAVRLLSATVNALYVSSRPGPLALSTGSMALAFVVGIGVAVASALAPALEAARVPPTEAMARGRREYDVRVERRRDAVLAVLLALAAAFTSRLPALGGKPVFGYIAALLLVAASALAIPALITILMPVLSAALRRLLGVEALLASRSLAGSLRRTSVLVGTLSTAIAMMTSVAIMVGSFRQTVVTWMECQLPADFYLRPAGEPGADRYPTIQPGLADRIAKLPGVAAVSRFRAYPLEYQGLPATLASAELDSPQARQGTEFLSGQPSSVVLRALATGNNTIVSEPFANKHHVHTGDALTLPLGSRAVPFHVIGIFYDYGDEGGIVLLARSTMLRYLPDPAASSLAVYLTPGADLETVRARIREAAAGTDVLLFSNGEIRREGIRTFDQTFAITYALEAVAILVAVLGVAGALISIVIDRRREFGLLRFLGASTSQIRGLILVEAGLIGILANFVGLLLGYLLSLILIYVINQQSFGWTIQFHWPVAVLIAALSGVYAATVLAGLYPASVAQHLNPIEVIHEE
ncbi:MAG TPA: FtsX-like permease family protein [Acidobacteriaceae bacterium]|jgi:putative ABC transport system permease protein|nr:FtsX-like permease family protein [Acidobacteriaceae bacterium]